VFEPDNGSSTPSRQTQWGVFELTTDEGAIGIMWFRERANAVSWARRHMFRSYAIARAWGAVQSPDAL